MRTMLYLHLVFLLTFSTFAQQPSPDPTAALSDALTALPETTAPLSLAQEFRTGGLAESDYAPQPDVNVRQWRPFDPPTIGVQVLSGAAGGAIGAGAGFLAGFGVLSGTLDGLIVGIYGSYVLSTLVGAPLGVYLGGKYMGGTGSAWGAMGGGAVGSLIGLAALSTDKEGDTGVPIAIMVALASPIIGYHLTAVSKTDSVNPMRSELAPRKVDPITPRWVDPVTPRWVDPVTPRPDLQMTVLSVPF